MAKKKKDEEEDSGEPSGVVNGLFMNKKLLTKLTKENGEIFRLGSEVLTDNKAKQIISISPAHDAALGGGLKEGTWVVITGSEKDGKTTTILQFIREAQRVENGSRKTIYLDGEGRLKDMNLVGIDGLDPSMIHVISADEKALAAEDALSLVESFLKDNERLIVVIDSVSSLLPKRDLESELSGEKRPGLPKLMGDFCKKLSGIVPRRNHIVILVTRFISNLGAMPGQSKKISDGGNHLRYQADTMLEISYTSPWVVDEKRIGQTVHWRVLCSACGGTPGTKFDSALRYGHGLDGIAELTNLAIENGLIPFKASWFKLGDKQIQGQDNVCQYLKENPEVQAKLLKDFMELIA